MANVTVKSHRAEVEKKLDNAMWNKMEKVGALVERQAKKNVTKSPPEHPQVQTGQLRSSIIHWTFKEDDNIVAAIGSNVYYSKYLELGTVNHPPYPFLMPAIDMNIDKIKTILGSQFTTQGDISNLDY